MKAVGYMRLSFKDQSRYSLEVQEAAIKEYCLRNQLELTALFTDNGQRSSTFDRVDFKALESFVKKHKGEIRYLIIMAHDRFSRDIAEALLKIRTLEDKHGLKVLSVDEPLDLDTRDPQVLANRTFKYLTANAELLNIRARTKNTIHGAKLAGRFINKAPYGYKNDRDFNGKSLLTVIPDHALLVQKIFHHYLLDLPVDQIRLEVTTSGFPNKGHHAIYKVLRNCIYAGLIRIVDELGNVSYVKALHEAIINEADFWLVQEIMNRKKPLKIKNDKEFPLKGLLKCHCGKYMTAAWSKGRRKQYLYYSCYVHRDVNVPGLKVHEQLEDLLKRFVLSGQQIAMLADRVVLKLNTSLQNQEQQTASRKESLRALDRRMENLEEAFIDKHIDVIMFKKWKERYLLEQRHLRTQIVELRQENIHRRRCVRQFMNQLSSLLQIYLISVFIQRQVLMKQVFRYGLTYVNGYLKPIAVISALRNDRINLNRPQYLSKDKLSTLVLQDEKLSLIEEERLFRILAEIIVELEF